jgi:hypothetical protein
MSSSSSGSKNFRKFSINSIKTPKISLRIRKRKKRNENDDTSKIQRHLVQCERIFYFIFVNGLAGWGKFEDAFFENHLF